MQSFQRFDRSTTLTIVLIIVAFLLATFDVRASGSGVGTTMREGAQTLFSPLQDAASAVTRPVVGFIDALSDLASLREENEALRLENEQLKTQIEQIDSIAGCDGRDAGFHSPFHGLERASVCNPAPIGS